jgi:hypothetical protein
LKHPLNWLLAGAVIVATVSLGFVLAMPRVSVLLVVVEVILMAVGLGLLVQRLRRPMALRSTPITTSISQASVLALGAFSIYMLVRASQPWPWIVLLVTAVVTEGLIIAGWLRSKHPKKVSGANE